VQPRWLPPRRSAAIEDVFDGEGIGILIAADVVSVRRDGQARSAVIKTAGEPELAYGQVLVAAGRHPVTAGLNLDAAGVETGGHGEIIADVFGRTANPRIWAAGDVTGGPQFVYVAAAAGVGRRRERPGRGRAGDGLRRAAQVTFTSPAIASAGLTEAELLRMDVATIAGSCRCRRCRARSSTGTRAG
jgi:mercuric reductase